MHTFRGSLAPQVALREVVTSLLIEDTWTSGGNAQSAALTLRNAGAASVMIVALARWLNPAEQPTGEFVSSRLTEDYDPLVCPVGNPACTRSGQSGR